MIHILCFHAMQNNRKHTITWLDPIFSYCQYLTHVMRIIWAPVKKINDHMQTQSNVIARSNKPVKNGIIKANTSNILHKNYSYDTIVRLLIGVSVPTTKWIIVHRIFLHDVWFINKINMKTFTDIGKLTPKRNTTALDGRLMYICNIRNCIRSVSALHYEWPYSRKLSFEIVR